MWIAHGELLQKGEWMKSALRTAMMSIAMALAAPSLAAQAQTYPVKPIRIVVPFAPGGSNDLLGRVLSQKLTEAWGQPVIIDNRPGGGSTIGIEVVARAAPDGYTLLTTSGGIAINVSLYKLSYNPVTDLTPVVLLAQMPYLLAANPALPVKSVKELIELARAKPGKLAFSSSGAGTSSHLTMELLKSAANIDMLHVPYKGGAPSVNAVMSNETQLTFNVLTGTLPHVRSGKLKALGVSSSKRAEVAPDIPAIAEAGLPGFDVLTWYNVFAPAGTPRTIVDRLNAEINRMLQQPDVRERFKSLGVSPLGGTPDELGNLLKSEIVRYAKLVKQAGVKIE
jgi:tripartite-type tricarboxylate transporter receptor subunit TctC